MEAWENNSLLTEEHYRRLVEQQGEPQQGEQQGGEEKKP